MRKPLLISAILLSAVTLTGCSNQEDTDGFLKRTDAYVLRALTSSGNSLVGTLGNLLTTPSDSLRGVLFDIDLSDRGELLSETEEVVQVLIKNKADRILTVYDAKTDAIIEIPVSSEIFYATTERQEIKALKKIYNKDAVKKAYYSIIPQVYNDASPAELEEALEVTVTNVPVEIVDKTKAISKTITYTLYYRYDNEPYVIQNIVSSNLYESATIGTKVLAEKTEYTLKNGKKVSRFELVKTPQK